MCCLPFSSLKEVWVTVLNITGPLSSWSFADNILPGMKILSNSTLVLAQSISLCSSRNFTLVKLVQLLKQLSVVHLHIYVDLVEQAMKIGPSG